MNQLNIYRNIFLEKEELMNLQGFLQNSLFKQLLLQATYTYGIVTNDPSKFNKDFQKPDEFKPNEPFKVEQGTTNGTYKVLPGLAFNNLGQVIFIEDIQDNIVCPQDDQFYWVKISYDTRNYELGTVSVNQKGNVNGNVSFLGKVRGQAGSTPVSIRFEKEDGSNPLNDGVYQIVSVVDDQNLILTSNAEFTPETNLRVVILGTIPITAVFSKEQKAGLYTYDFYRISLVREIEVSTPPAKEDTEFYISRIRNSGGSITIDNSVKKEFWSLAGFVNKGKE